MNFEAAPESSLEKFRKLPGKEQFVIMQQLLTDEEFHKLHHLDEEETDPEAKDNAKRFRTPAGILQYLIDNNLLGEREEKLKSLLG